MPQPAGQIILNGLHVKDSADNQVTGQGAEPASNRPKTACPAQRKPQRHRHRIVIQMDYGYSKSVGNIFPNTNNLNN